MKRGDWDDEEPLVADEWVHLLIVVLVMATAAYFAAHVVIWANG